MLRKLQLHFRKSLTIWSFVLIILVNSVYVEAAKATRRGGQKGKPNHDAIALSYGGSRHTGTAQQHQTKQVYPQAASAPPSNSNKPIGWNIPASNAPVQPKTIPNTNTGFQTPAHNTGYAPPPYNTHTQYSPHSATNSGPPPAYSAPNPGYPQQPNPHQGSYNPQPYPQGGYNPQPHPQGGYNPQPYPQGGYNPQSHPQGINNPPPYSQGVNSQQPMGYNGQQQPVINNYYQQPTQTGGSGGSSIAKNALLLGAGGIAGAVAYGALKSGGETNTVIVHDTVPSQPPNVLPAAAAPTPVQTSETNVPLAQPSVPLAQAPPNLAQPSVPLAQAPPYIPLAQPSTDVPLAAMPDTTGSSQPTVPSNMSGSETTLSTVPIVPLAPMPDPNVASPKITEQRSNNVNNATNAEIPVSTSVPAETNQSSQAHLKGHATHLQAFNISIYAAISMIFAKFLI